MLKRLAHAFLAFSFGQFLLIITNILLVPMYLRVWTPELYGEWLALSAVVMYLSNLDLGMQTYVLNRLTQSYARQDMHDYQQQQHSAVAFYLALTGIGTALLAAVAHWAPLTRWFNLVHTPGPTAKIVFVLLGAQVLWGQLGFMTFSVYRTAGRVATSQWISNGYRLLSTGITLIALFYWKTLTAVATAQLAVSVAAVAIIIWDVRRRFPELTPALDGARFSVIRQQLRPSLLFGLIALAIALGMQGANLVVVGALGGAALALFATTRTLVNSIRQLISICTNVSWTDVTRLEARGERGQLQLALRLVVIVSTAACIAVAGPLWFEGDSVIRVWTHNRLVPDVTLLRMLLTYVVLQTPWTAASLLPMSTNKNKRLTISYIVANAIGITVAALLIKPFGMAGVPAGLIFGEAIGCYYFVPADACRIVGQPYLRFATRIWLGMGLVASASILAAWNVHQVPGIPTVLRWAFSGLVSVGVVGAATWLVWLAPTDRGILRAKIVYGWGRLSATTDPTLT